MQETLEHLTQLQEERTYYIEVLKLWQHVADHRGRSYDVHAFTFRDEYLTADERKDQRLCLARTRKPLYCDKTHHNAVRLKDGDVVPIPMIKRPIPPDHLKVKVEKKF